MEMFFKQDNIIVDIDGGNVIETLTGKVMTLNFDDMTMKPFNTRSKLTPIRFNDRKQLLLWEPVRNRWTPFKERFPTNVLNAIDKLIEVKIEKELLG